MSRASLSAKLQIPKGKALRVVNPPEGFEMNVPEGRPGDPVLVFAKDSKELMELGRPAFEAAKEDTLSWIAYPKAGKLGTDLNRDDIWKRLEKMGIRPVRMVSVDETWAAMRFRPGKVPQGG